MDMSGLRAVLTVAMVLVFLGIVMWAYSSRRKKEFDEAARSVLEDDATAAADEQRGRGA